MKKIFPIVLVLAGVLMVAIAGFFAWHTIPSKSVVNVGVDVPNTMAGYSLSSTQSGETAKADINKLHGVDLPMVSAIVALYGNNEGRLWVSVTESQDKSAEMIQSMTEKIALGESPFSPMGVFQFQNRDVYMLNNNGLVDFYIQSGTKVVWAEVPTEHAETAMKELLVFYPQ